MKTVTLAACSVVLGFAAVSACGGSAQGPAGGIASGAGGDSASSGKGGGATGGSAGKGGAAGRGGSSGSAGKGGAGKGGGAGSGTGGSSGGGAVAGTNGEAGDVGNAGETSGGSAGTGGAAGRGGSAGTAGATGGSGGSSADCEITTDVVASCMTPSSSGVASCIEYYGGSFYTTDSVEEACAATDGTVFSAGSCADMTPDGLPRLGCCVTPGTSTQNCYYGDDTLQPSFEAVCTAFGCGFSAG